MIPLGEISDKIPTIWAFLLYSSLAALVVGGVARQHRWLTPLPLLPAVLAAYVLLDDLRASDWRGAILGEMGYSYVAGSLLSVSLPFLLVTWLLMRAVRADDRRRHFARRLAGRCGPCGYDLTGNVSGVCPECGAPCGHGQPVHDWTRTVSEG